MFASFAICARAMRRRLLPARLPSASKAIALGLLSLATLASLSRAVAPTQDTLKLTPASIATESVIDPDVQRLSDRDTGTAYSPASGQVVILTLDAATEIRSLKFFGAAPFVANVQAQSGNSWKPVAGLQNLDLTALPETWNSFGPASSVTTPRLRIELTPAGGSASSGLKEIEVWGGAIRSFIGNGSQLVTLVDSKNPPMQGRSYAATPTQGVIGSNSAAPDDPSDNHFTVDINRHPADAKRAYLVYETNGLSHWSSGIRAINGNAAQGDWLLQRSDTWSTQIESINPAWLKQGSNAIDFAAGTAGIYSVRNVRIVFELEDGTNFVQKVVASGTGSTAAYDGDTGTGWAPYAASSIANGVATLDALFDKPTQVAGLRLNIAGTLGGKINVAFLSNGNWVDSSYTAFNASSLVAGWNDLNYPSSFAVDGVRLTFQGGSSVTGDVRELVVSGSGTGQQAGAPALRVTYPDNGQFVGRQAYIRGFLAPLDNGSGPARVYVGGTEVPQVDGAFGVTVSKEELGLLDQADRDPWSVEVKAVYPDATEVRQVVQLNRYSDPVIASKDGLSTLYAKVPPGKARKLAYSGAELDIGANALDTELTFGMTPLRDTDVPRLDAGMTNVTKGPPKGYRFTPHGAHFKNKIQVTLPYDRNAIPPGQSEQDVTTFYFDEEAGRWMPLERAQVDAQKGVIVSYTDHFTDMINATITVPDHPNPASLNPTSIKDIKAADPGAQINLIEPPKANNMGDARLSYPIELPPGRNGMQPSLAVQYNSGGGNGWMGLGWDIALQSVSIDTRWGVPRYDAALETETYVLDGEPLTPVAHRGELKPRSAEKRFHTRIEGQFRRIVRHGDAPANYWWEVTDKNGMRFFYGGTPEGGQDKNAILADPGSKGNVFRWALKEVRDTNGNNIVYGYDIVNGGAGGEPWRQIYLRRINYTGSQGGTGPYQVTFSRAGGRTDVVVDGRAGFKTVMDQRLTGIDVALNSETNPLVRLYSFDYRTGAFTKTLLTKVTQYGEDGMTEFNHHDFEYFDDARDTAGNYHGFSSPVDWNIGSDSVSAGLLGKGLASALGGSKSESAGGHLYVGVGVGDASSKLVTVGPKIGYSKSGSETLIAMADMNGDGLPDKVFKGAGGFYYRPNLSGPRGTPTFGDDVRLDSLPAISREKVTSTTIGVETHVAPGVAAMVDHNRSINQADTYFSDVNGDGLIDLVSGGRVLFGYVNAAGVPTFSTNSADTPVVIGASVINTNGILEDASQIEVERAAAFPLLDTVRRWVAPYDGIVQINAPVRLLEDKTPDRATYNGADGVRVAIQLEGAELWSTSIAATDYAVHTPTGVASVPVRRGDRLYFRVQSVFDGAYDQVAWDAQVSYLNVDASRTDVNNLPVYAYRSSQDFTLAGRKASITVPLTGTLHLGGKWEKTGVTTDDVTLSVTRNGSEVFRRTLGFAEVAAIDLSQDLAVNQNDVLAWHILVDSPIDATLVKLAPVAFYTSAQGVDRVTDDQGNYVLQVRAPYDMDLYPVDGLAVPQQFYVAAATGTIPVQATLQMNGLASGQQANAVFTVKKRGALLAKQIVSVTGTGSTVTQTVTLNVPVATGDQIYFDLSARDAAFASANLNVTVAGAPAPAAIHVPADEGLFAQPYRGWAAVGYNGNGDWATKPIDQSALVLTQQTDANNMRVYPFVPNPTTMSWGGVDDSAWVKAAEISSSRLGLDDIRMPTGSQFAGAAAVTRISESVNDSVSVGITGSKGNSRSKLEFQDLNGDRYPDVISQGGVQYTSMTGPLEGDIRNVGLGSARESDNETYGASTDGAGNIARAIATARGTVAGDTSKNATTAQQGMDMPSLGLSANIGTGKADTQNELIDINGDGLPDKVFEDGTVALNLGYRFAAREQWGGGILNHGRSLDAGGGISLGYQKDNLSWGGGLSLTIGKSESDENYLDINGDGLPDKIVAGNPFTVRLNTGNGFTNPIVWPANQDGKVSLEKHVSLGGGAYFTYGFTFFGTAKFVINPGINFSTSMGRPEVGFRDMDGDGYVDYVASEKASELQVGGNPIGRTNLLKRITRPLGAVIDLDYIRDGNTYEQPHSKWVLSRTTVFDGHPGDGVDKLLTTYDYADGYYDRAERDFYGYAKVTETQRDIARGEAAYRRNISEYHNRDYYTKGLLARNVLEDGNGRAYTETKHQYNVVVVADGAAVTGDENRSETRFPQLIRTDSAWYEGQASAGKQTYTTHRYDDLGNVIEFFDAGDAGADDDVKATIAYTSDTTNWIVGKPTRITVEGAGRVMREREATYAPGTGNLMQVRQYVGNGQAATTDLAYNPNGTIQSVTGPVNHRGQRYALAYSYDPVVNTHITGIVDSFGLSSTATYNLKYGKVTSTIDTNGNATETAYDTVGRVVAITGPYQTGTGDATIRFEYHPDAPTPWARTRHLDVYRNAADPIDTVLFTDGIKRVIQTKKDITLFTGATTAPLDVMSVSGRIVYDAFGRAVSQYYPVTEALGRAGIFNEAVDSVAPTRTEYDVLDRVTRTTLPDNTFTTMAYGFGADRNGVQQFQTVVTDANGKQKVSYRDVQEQITAVQEFNAGQSIWTSYRYDPLKQIIEVRDDRGYLTQASYDNLGRRIALDNPDTGLVTSEFDLAGNLTGKVTANLAAQHKTIRYTYDYGRLVKVNYPTFPGNDITYTYGAPKAPYNRAGRIVTVDDQSGREERFYGKLGETVREVRTIASKTQGNSANSPEVWTTDYLFDTFGRLQRLVYPDGEVLSFAYDAGGNVQFAQGQKQGQLFTYLTRLEYDKFEQRAYMAYGNGIRTQYTYHPQNRRLNSLEASGQGRTLQNLAYRYDNVGNILGLNNRVAIPPANSFGGPTTQSFGYDDLYRLTSATGTYDFAPNKRDQYRLSMAYDSIHNITSKVQSHEVVQPGGKAIEQKKTSYRWNYEYASVHPHAVTHLGERSYRFDANGNQTGWDHDRNGTRRTIIWDDENRIQSLFDNGHEKSYVYDDQGERVIKRGPQGETVYVNQWFTVRNREVASKHVFIGTTRIATALVPGVKALNGGTVPSGTTNANSSRLPAPAQRASGILNAMGIQQRSAVAAQRARNLEKNPHYANPAPATPGSGTATNQDNFLYFYHPDHLGSSSYVTDVSGRPYEHLEYFPFGETWVQESSNTQRTPYLFTGKELDEETGLYYYGARYYDPRTSVWQSPDRILGKYLEGEPNQGVFNSANLALYTYSYNSPIVLKDPDGNCPMCISGGIGAAFGAVVYVGRNLYISGGENWGSAKGLAIAAGSGFAIGSGAVLLPGTTAVVAAGLTGYSAGDVANRASNYSNLSPQEKRAVQADAALTALAVVGTIAQGAKATPATASESAPAAPKPLHGNNLNTTKPAQGYTLRNRDTGEILKYGETTRGTARYSQKYLKDNNARMVFEAQGTKREMHQWQHEKILEYKTTNGGQRPPLNKSDY
ncbi:SpvB/TcaC N-terminal domain-containing protein [Noviherbaspirillum massiliense]|uniref:SpvB/TcaC N-terminal domain-containing protein n=1 Tax=Noviherbaspirillum massiliense TaxID=1465823 RepID=UPI00030FF45E|nr:SpvB/TcaC N-terminal domain-containing protein [Noviherbaspirillum massiliense]